MFILDFIVSHPVLLAIAVLAVIVVMLTSFRIAQQYERALVFRFGRYIDTRGPGLFWMIPLGIDRAIKVDMRVFTGEPGREYRETLQSSGEAAAAGGVTSFVAMPDTLPVIDDGALIDYNVRAERMGWLPSAPQLQLNPLMVAAKAATQGMEPKDYVAQELKSGSLRL